MPHFVMKSNLPEGKLCVAAAGEDYYEVLEKGLAPFGVTLLKAPKNPKVDSRLASHIDLSVFHFGGSRFLLAKSLASSEFELALRLLGADLVFAEREQGTGYPEDASLCALGAGSALFHNFRHSDEQLPRFYGGKHAHVKQGYTKCACCLVSERAAITADKGLKRAMTDAGMAVLEISPGLAELAGFPEGFIGGAAFKLSGAVLAFTGKIENSGEKQRIDRFLQLHGVKAVYLTDRRLFDAGSVIPVLEE